MIDEIKNSILHTINLEKIVLALLTFIVCFVLMKIVRAMLSKLLDKSKKLDGTLKAFIRPAVTTVMWILTALLVADALGIPTTSLVAAFSVVGLALSLSVQNIMANLFSGITLLASRPFVVGDFVEIAGRTGTVKSIGLFYTTLDTVDNMVVSLPNGDVTASSIVNYNTETHRRVDMLFRASYEDETELVKEAIMEAIGKDERIFSEPAPFVAINGYRAAGVEYAVKLWCENSDYWPIYYNMNENVRASFKDKGITMVGDGIQLTAAK